MKNIPAGTFILLSVCRFLLSATQKCTLNDRFISSVKACGVQVVYSHSKYDDMYPNATLAIHATRFPLPTIQNSTLHHNRSSELQSSSFSPPDYCTLFQPASCLMPWNLDPFAASISDDIRKNIISQLCRLSVRDPRKAAEAYLNLRPYKEHPGFVYAHLRSNWEILDNADDVPEGKELDWVDVRVGKCGDMTIQRDYYAADCVGEPIAWVFCYETSHPKLIERLTHLTLADMGAKRIPYPCHGCNIRHREHSSEAKSGGLEVVGGIIEYWIVRIGEVPTQIPLYD
ncbi:hypothetical protein B0H19DRAFT_1056220 [Mycena capillaripes]|nr:hypothetical protein B0H19DRAFT_1056220 [Mycena capillaripes]